MNNLIFLTSYIVQTVQSSFVHDIVCKLSVMKLLIFDIFRYIVYLVSEWTNEF